jgi:hypothetical protein
MDGEQIGTQEDKAPVQRRRRQPVEQASEINAAPEGGRRRRRIADGGRDVLGFSGQRDPNFQYRIVNDSENRVNEMLERGYEIVQDGGQTLGEGEVGKASTLGSQVRRVVNKSNGTQGVLMRIRKDWYAEDQADKARIVNQSEEGLLPANRSEHYAPRDDGGEQIGIKIGR